MGTASYRGWAEAVMSLTGTGNFSTENLPMTAYNHLVFRLTVEEEKSIFCSKDNTFNLCCFLHNV